MCDTMGKIVGGVSYFAKNSDRSPNEPQVLEYRPRKSGLSGMLRATYIEIPQAETTYATLLSRPVWMWGAEMGVNEFGVCIGNEAVFTKGKYAKAGALTGMDLLRLALERSRDAKQALKTIIDLLETYGQGGNCGYDHAFYYDNSFLIMDAAELYILETAGKKWAYKKADSGAISNRLSLGTDAIYSGNAAKYDFTATHLEPIFSHFSGSATRLASTTACVNSASENDTNTKYATLPQNNSNVDVNDTLNPQNVDLNCEIAANDFNNSDKNNEKEGVLFQLIGGLRTHTHSAPPLTKASVKSPCMHAGGLVGDHTTSSMAVELRDGKIIVWASGSSTPCISLMKPWVFGNPLYGPYFPAGEAEKATACWLSYEEFHRSLIGKTLPDSFYNERDGLETKWKNLMSQNLCNITEIVAADEKAFYQKWTAETASLPVSCSGSLKRYWQKKTAALNPPARVVINGD